MNEGVAYNMVTIIELPSIGNVIRVLFSYISKAFPVNSIIELDTL